MHRTEPGFWSDFDRLPESAKRIANRNFDRLKEDPRYPSLRFKKAGRYWSVRIGGNYRALSVEDCDEFVGVWIGTHAEYVRLIGR